MTGMRGARVLAYEMLDRHVIAGRGDDTACTDATGPLTFAQLLERSAALAGGLAVLGIRAGDPVEVDLPGGNVRVIAACAVIRLGAAPAPDGRAWIGLVDDVPTVRVSEPEHEHSHDLTVVERAGRSDPAAATVADLPGYADTARDAYSDIVDPLLTGSPVV